MAVMNSYGNRAHDGRRSLDHHCLRGMFVIVRIAAATGASAARQRMAPALVDRLALSSDAAALESPVDTVHLRVHPLW